MPQPAFMSDSDESLSLFCGEIVPENGFEYVSVAAPSPGTSRLLHTGFGTDTPSVTPLLIAAPYDDCEPATHAACFESNSEYVPPVDVLQLQVYASSAKL